MFFSNRRTLPQKNNPQFDWFVASVASFVQLLA